jgi:hypothetical protein
MATHETRTDPPGEQQDRDGRSLSEQIECHMERRLCGRIVDLHVVCYADRIVLRGRSRTYHAKQLALEAVLDLTGAAPRLVNEIIVG